MKYEPGLKKIKKSRQTSANGGGKKHLTVDEQMLNSLKNVYKAKKKRI